MGAPVLLEKNTSHTRTCHKGIQTQWRQSSLQQRRWWSAFLSDFFYHRQDPTDKTDKRKAAIIYSFVFLNMVALSVLEQVRT